MTAIPEPSPPARVRKGTRKAMHQLLVAAGRLSSEVEEVCGEFGITRDQYLVLRILSRGGEEGISRGALAGRMTARAPDVTRLLDRLEERGLVRRIRGAADRRLTLSVLTPGGEALLAALRPRMDGALERFSAPLPRREIRRLTRLLGALGE